MLERFSEGSSDATEVFDEFPPIILEREREREEKPRHRLVHHAACLDDMVEVCHFFDDKCALGELEAKPV